MVQSSMQNEVMHNWSNEHYNNTITKVDQRKIYMEVIDLSQKNHSKFTFKVFAIHFEFS